MQFVIISQTDLWLEDGRRLQVDEPFLAATTEITVKQFEAFANANPGFKTDAESAGLAETWRTALEAGEFDLPVVHVTPRDAEAFTQWMSKSTGRDIKVPDATRWELAARAGATTRFAFGPSMSSNEAVVKPSPLGLASLGKRNAAGLTGVHGNAAEIARLPNGEWVRLGGDFTVSRSEVAFTNPERARPANSQAGDSSTGFRPIILRGGS